jgi:hypothetical protein
MSNKIAPRFTAVAFAVALTLAGTAEAGPLFGGTAGPVDSPWSLAWEWLAEAWGDLTGLHTATASDTVQQQDNPCGDCTANDSGWGIDPNGGG